MFVKAISNQEVTGDYIHIEAGSEINGNARSYSQGFITITEMFDNPYYIQGETDENGFPENIDDMFKYRDIKVDVEIDSIERVYCDCGEFAVRKENSEYFCSECKYEKHEGETLDTGYHAMDYMRDWDD